LSAADADTVTDAPPTIAFTAGALIETVGAVTSGVDVTDRLKVAVFVTPPPTAETVTVHVPTAVEDVVLMVIVELQVGMHDPGANAPVAPAGRPETENVTPAAAPLVNVAVAALVTLAPGATDFAPPVDSAKSNAGAGVVADTGTDWADALPALSYAATE
jgi:hypothetical protein